MSQTTFIDKLAFIEIKDWKVLITLNAEIEKIDYFPHSKKYLCSPVDNLIFDDLNNKGLID